MTSLVSTQNTQINADSDGNLFIYNHPLGITLSDLALIKDEGYNFGFPFSRIDLANVAPSKHLPASRFERKGALISNYSKSIHQFREEFIINSNLSFCFFKNPTTLEIESKALIFTFHNGFNCGDVIFNTSYDEFLKERNDRLEQQRLRRMEYEAEMHQPLKGWYVVTLSLSVMVHKGNDGNRVYSFRILADSQYDAFNKASEFALTPGNIQDKNVYLVSMVNDSINSALIEFVGVWTDEAEMEFN